MRCGKAHQVATAALAVTSRDGISRKEMGEKKKRKRKRKRKRKKRAIDLFATKCH